MRFNRKRCAAGVAELDMVWRHDDVGRTSDTVTDNPVSVFIVTVEAPLEMGGKVINCKARS